MVVLAEPIIPIRTLPALGFLVFCSLLPFVYFNKISSYFSVVLSMFLIFTSITISFSFGSALKGQHDYDASVLQMVRDDLIKNEQIAGKRTTVYGVTKNSMRVEEIVKRAPLVDSMKNNMYDWTGSLLLTQYGVQNIYFSFDDRDNMHKKMQHYCLIQQKPIVSNSLYSIFDNEGKNVVWLGYNKNDCQ
ncbi:hypothetical protein [Sodalis ligni]|uniref:hypothetical protein n=1 Tax=Sodalis ligni TaxID=2697027 RepID=UPI001050E755|nr:hypothetical protein [Sodalis ligni]